MSMDKRLEEAFIEDVLLTLNQTTDLCNELKRELSSNVELFREEELAQASLEFDKQLSALQTLLKSMQTMQVILSSEAYLKEVWVENLVHWRNAEAKFRKALLSSLSHFREEDFYALADCIESDLLESIDSWKDYIDYIITSLHELK